MAQELNSLTEGQNFLGNVEQVGKLLGIAAAALLILSTAYDFCFLYALGLSFEDVPSTIADHVRSAVVWAPRATIYAMGLAVYEMFMRTMEKGLSEEELIERSPNPRFMRAFRRSPQVLFAILAVLMIVTNTLLTASSHGLFLAGLGLWGLLSVGIVLHPRMGAKFTTTGGRLFVIVPIVVIWVGFMGYGRGESMLSNPTTQWTVVLKSEQGTEKRELIGLRRFQLRPLWSLPGDGFP